MDALGDSVQGLFRWLHGFVGDYGVAIVLGTLLVRLAMLPLTLAQRRGSIVLRSLKPELERLRYEYGADKQAFQRAQMELLRERGFNPFAGCMTLLVMMVLIIAFYRGIENMAVLQGETPFWGRTWISDLGRPDRLFDFGTKVPLLGRSFHLLPWLPVVFSLVVLAVPNWRAGLGEHRVVFLFGPVAVAILLYDLPSAVWLCLLVFLGVTAVEQIAIPLPPLPEKDEGETMGDE